MHLGAGYFGGLCQIGKDTCDGQACRASASNRSKPAGGGVRAGAAGLENPTLCELHSRDLLSPGLGVLLLTLLRGYPLPTLGEPV